MGNQYFVKYYFWISSWSYYVFYDKIKKPASPVFVFLLYDRRALKCPTEINQMNQIN
jgi:hypothetical protein